MLRRIIWQPSGGHWLFYLSAIYLAVAMYSIFVEKFAHIELIQVAWLCIIALPLVCNPLARWLNMKETHMFDMFKKKNKLPDNVVPFPKKEETEYGGGRGYIPEPKKPAVTYYTLGMTSENRLELKMGYSAITMNYGGLCNLMDQLEVYKKQLAEYEGIEEEESPT
jgi:hypothetical protein